MLGVGRGHVVDAVPFLLDEVLRIPEADARPRPVRLDGKDEVVVDVEAVQLLGAHLAAGGVQTAGIATEVVEGRLGDRDLLAERVDAVAVRVLDLGQVVAGGAEDVEAHADLLGHLLQDEPEERVLQGLLALDEQAERAVRLEEAVLGVREVVDDLADVGTVHCYPPF